MQNRASLPTSLFWFTGALAILWAGWVVVTRPISGATFGLDYSAPQVVASKLAPGTEGLLRQTAEHLSKMQGGVSVGGFPGFEPPDDDEKYRSKIQDESYSGAELNHWLKEINNFLRQVIDKNPSSTLKEILQKQGLAAAEIDDFIFALQRTHYQANGMATAGSGVNAETVNAFEALLKTLRVLLWPY